MAEFNIYLANSSNLPKGLTEAEVNQFAEENRKKYVNDLQIANCDIDFRLRARLFDESNRVSSEEKLHSIRSFFCIEV